MALPPRHRLGRFEIVSLLGVGGMGEVYRARDTRLGRDVALKVLAPALSADDNALQRFEQEARVVSGLAHPNIVTIFDVGSDDQSRYLVTELLDGATLRERLERGPLPLSTVLEIAIQIAAALAAAHAAGIVHRDLKPHNVFITRSGVAKLLDFGISRLTERPQAGSETEGTVAHITATREGTILGTPSYMSPEQARGLVADARADLFAFGCVMYEMLSGVVAFERPTSMDTFAAVLSAEPVPLAASLNIPPVIQRTVNRCLQKDPADRFQSAKDLLFVLEAARDEAFGRKKAADASQPRHGSTLLLGAAGAAVLSAIVTSAVWMRSAPPPASPPVLKSTVVVPASAKPIAPAISPDGKWVAYVGLADGRPDVYVQFLAGGAPVNLTRDADMPVQNRTIVGGIDILPDGSGVAVAGRPRPVGLWQTPGIWILPAPSGGPARRVTDRYAAMRWSPDGRRVAGVLANPLLGDALAIAAADGQDERVLVPLRAGLHLHHVAWGHDGRHVYYTRTLEVNHSLGDIYRVSADGGSPEVVVATAGTVMYPTPLPDGKALIYAGNHAGEGLNIWLRPLDGSPEWRLTTGAGEYTEPFVSRSSDQLVCLARRRRGELIRVPVSSSSSPPAVTVVGSPGSGDGEPSVGPGNDRIFISSQRSGHRRIWSIDETGQRLTPLTSGADEERRPAISPDGRTVAFVSNRGGRRGIWVVPAEGGTARLLVHAEVVEAVSWAPDSKRLVYAAADRDDLKLWIVDAAGGAPTPLAGDGGRTPTWSPVGDVIAAVRASDDVPYVHFFSGSGAVVREPLAIGPLSVPTAMAWSPDGLHLGMVNLPGRAAAEAWIVRVADGNLHKLAEFPAPAELDGVTWTRDGQALLVGRIEYESEVLLIEGFQRRP
jgi:Tol biopolymer transport system component